MKTSAVIQELNNSFKLTNSDKYRDNDLKIVQIITSNNQRSIKESLCILYNNVENFRYDDSCYYLIPEEYRNTLGLKLDYSLYNRDDFLNIVMYLYDLLTDEKEYFDKVRDLNTFILTHDSLDDIAEYLYGILHNPLVFVDPYFTSIASFPRDKTGLDAYDWFFDTIYQNIDVSFVEDKAAELLYPDIIRTAASYFPGNQVPCISSSVISDGRVISGFSVYGLNRPLNQTDLKVIDYAMLLLSSTRAVSSVRERINYASIYRKIISGSLDDEAVFKTSESLKLKFDEKYVSIFIQMKDNVGLTNPLSEIKRRIDTKLFGFFENCLMLTVKPSQLDDKLIELCRHKCHQYKTSFFVFDIPLPLRETNIAYNLSQKLIQIKPNFRAFDIYYDIVFKYGDILVNNHYLLYYDELKSLKKEDYLTIREFVFSHLNLNKTSSRLCIHRNTLSYRLNKIASILKIDYENDVQMSNLLLSLKLCDNDILEK